MVAALLFIALIAASLWLLTAEGIVSAALFFVFGLVVIGALSFVLQLGDAVGGWIDRFIRRFGRR